MSHMDAMIGFSLLLIAITAVLFYKIGNRDDAEIDRESFNAGIKEGVSGVLEIFASKGIILLDASGDYVLPINVEFEDPTDVNYDE